MDRCSALRALRHASRFQDAPPAISLRQSAALSTVSNSKRSLWFFIDGGVATMSVMAAGSDSSLGQMVLTDETSEQESSCVSEKGSRQWPEVAHEGTSSKGVHVRSGMSWGRCLIRVTRIVRTRSAAKGGTVKRRGGRHSQIISTLSSSQSRVFVRRTPLRWTKAGPPLMMSPPALEADFSSRAGGGRTAWKVTR